MLNRCLGLLSAGPGRNHLVRPCARRDILDLKKLRGKKLVSKIGNSRRYEATPEGLKVMTPRVAMRSSALNRITPRHSRKRTPRHARHLRRAGNSRLKHRQSFFHACTSATMSPPTLESRGRTDVIRALSAHCIEYQSNFHSIQSAAAVYLRRPWQPGLAAPLPHPNPCKVTCLATR